MTEGLTITCRLCLNTIEDVNSISNNSDSERDVIQIVIPQIDLNFFGKAIICRKCSELLQHAFRFKSKCLEIEDSIHDYEKDEEGQVDLEKILGIERNSSECIKICRTCLEYLDNNTFIELNKENGLKVALGNFIPELDIGLTFEPVICNVCEETFNKISNFITHCLGNEEKVKSYQLYLKNVGNADNANFSEFLQYELNKDSPNAQNDFQQRENDHNTATENEVDQSLQQKNSAEVATTADNNQICVISDSEEDTSNIETTEARDNKSTGHKYARKRSVSTVDLDTTESEEENCTQVRKKPRANNKGLNPAKRISAEKLPLKYCFVTNSDIAAQQHMLSCSRVPCVVNIKKDETIVRRGTREIKLNDKSSLLVSNPSSEILRQNMTDIGKKSSVRFIDGTRTWTPKVITDLKKEQRERTLADEKRSVRLAKGSTWKPTVITEEEYSKGIIISQKPNLNKTTDNVDNSVSGSSQETEGRKLSVDEDCVIVENQSTPLKEKNVPDADFTLEAAKIDTFQLRRKTGNDEVREKELELAIEGNDKKLILGLTIFVCNYCEFNSRSVLKMALHCTSHPESQEKVVNDVGGYRTVFYCVNCTRLYRAASYLHSHIPKCPRMPDDKVFLFRLGRVMHCIKCSFDSDNKKLILDHLLKCKDIVTVGKNEFDSVCN